jgi:alpha-beta hydrolase superfamily lysophospholipase
MILTSASATAVEITAPGPQGELHGTYLAPAEGQPIVLIIPGSGPTDRDGNNPLGIRAAPYRLLAEALADRGIGSVRVDKRGLFASALAVPDPNAVSIEDYVADVASWTATIRERAAAQCVWLAGHSEGGLIALAAAGKVEALCGLVLISVPGRKLGTILREQFTANPANAPILPDALGAIEKLERGEHVDVAGFHPALQQVFAPQVQDFLIDMMALDPATLASATELPILILQGDRDIQVSLADAEALHAAQPAARYAVLEHVNHVLKSVESEDRAANAATYANPDLPLAPSVAEAVAAFVSGAHPTMRVGGSSKQGE